MIKIAKFAVILFLAIVFCFFNINISKASTAEEIQPAEDVIYGERLRTDSAVSAGRASYFYEGMHLGGVIFADHTIVNSSLDDNGISNIPVTFGDDVRIDGEIWRGTSKGISDGMPLKISDTMIPTMTDINDIGSTTNRWKNGYFAGAVTVGDLEGANIINEENLNVTNSATAGQVLSYNQNGQFTWIPITGSSDGDGTSDGGILPAGTSGQTIRYGSNGWEASSLIYNDGTDIDIAGGFGDSGVTIYDTTGGINANGALSASSLTTGGMLTVGGISALTGNVIASSNLTVGGGYGSTGVTIYDTGSLFLDGNFLAGGNTSLGGILGVTGTASVGGGYGDATDGGTTIYDDGMIVAQGDYGTATTLEASGEATKLLWYPRKSAFRAGYVDSVQWDNSNIGDYSMALGYDALASGDYSAVLGRGSATGEYAISTGYGATTSGDKSYSWGGDKCNPSSTLCENNREGVFAVFGGLCVDDPSNNPGAGCPDVGDGTISYDTGVDGAAYDLAEGFSTNKKLEKGDVVVLVDNVKVGHTNTSYDKRVIGVVSTTPNISFNFDGESNNFSSLGGLDADYEMPENLAPITLAGRIPTKVINENGNIEIGDLLTTSSREGYAMKFTLRDTDEASDFDGLKSILKENEERRNSIFGKALESCDQEECKIMTLLSLQ